MNDEIQIYLQKLVIPGYPISPQRLCEKFHKTSAQALVNAIAKVQERGDIAKSHGDSNW